MQLLDQAAWVASHDKLREANDLLYAARVTDQDARTIRSLSQLHRQALADYSKTVERIDA